MNWKIFCLNIEGDKHFSKWIPFVKNIAPDIICLQEVPAKDFDNIKKNLSMEGYFFPQIKRQIKDDGFPSGPRGVIGIAMLSKLTFKKVEYKLYFGNPNKIPLFVEPNSQNRGLLICSFENLTIATTHFTWNPDGNTIPQQQKDLKEMLNILKNYQKIILCGDFNTPRGRDLYSILSKIYVDNIPKKIKSTLDPDLHRAGLKDFVVDGLFSSKDYLLKNVKVISGLSDHQALIGEIKMV